MARSSEEIERIRERNRQAKHSRETQPNKPVRNRRRSAAGAVVAAMLAVIMCVGIIALFSILPGIKYNRAYERSLMQPVGDPNAAPPEISATSAIMYSLDLDKPVYEKNADEKLSPYSVTKILTCYLALENLDPDQVVTVSEDAVAYLEDGTTMNLQAGEKISVRDLLYGAMMPSGNDAAYALAEAVAGSTKAFAKMMNDKAAEWGCTNTHFVNPNGWKNDNHYTTARDFCIITMKCFENEELKKISMTEDYVVPATNKSEERVLDNHTTRATRDAGAIVTCGKTGGWTGKDSSLVLEFDDGEREGAIVLIKDTVRGRRKDAKKLTDFAPLVTPGFTVSTENDEVCLGKVRHGAVTRVALAPASASVAYPASGDTKDIKIKTKINKLEAPVAKGDVAGKYYVYANDELVAERDLVATEDVATGWLPSYLYISNIETVCLILAVLISVLIGYALAGGKRRKYKRR